MNTVPDQTSSADGPNESLGSAEETLPEMAARLIEIAPSFKTLFPSTRYFEMDSKLVGERFAAWVTLPAQYDGDSTQAFPVIYQVDGNLFFPATAPFHQAGERDPMSPIKPFILVSVGYCERESSEWTWLRVRNLLPPNEVVPEVMDQALQYSIEAGLVRKDDGERYRAMFAQPAGDKFLGFLEDELHPHLAQAFRIDGDDVGLWGDSYGGLFTAYVAIKQSKLFKRIGAGSPGIIGNDSQVLKLYDAALTSKLDYSGRQLHVTLGSRELTQSSIYQAITARGTSELLARTSMNPLPGLEVTSELIPLETHVTGTVPAWFSFLRACYGRS